MATLTALAALLLLLAALLTTLAALLPALSWLLLLLLVALTWLLLLAALLTALAALLVLLAALALLPALILLICHVNFPFVVVWLEINSGRYFSFPAWGDLNMCGIAHKVGAMWLQPCLFAEVAGNFTDVSAAPANKPRSAQQHFI